MAGPALPHNAVLHISTCSFALRRTAPARLERNDTPVQVKCIIGSELVDANQTLYDEASAYADILGEVQLRTEQILTRQRLCASPQRKLVSSQPATIPWSGAHDMHCNVVTAKHQHTHRAHVHLTSKAASMHTLACFITATVQISHNIKHCSTLSSSGFKRFCLRRQTLLVQLCPAHLPGALSASRPTTPCLQLEGEVAMLLQRLNSTDSAGLAQDVSWASHISRMSPQVRSHLRH